MNWLEPHFALADIPANLSYVIIAVSYYLRNILWLRTLAIVGLVLEIDYFALTSADLLTGIAWDTVFILINAYQVYWLLCDRRALKVPPNEKFLLHRVLEGLDDAQIAKLLRISEWRMLSPDEVLTREARPVTELYFLCSGRAAVNVHGATVAHLEGGSFVGEVAFLTGGFATASVVVETPTKILAFARDGLDDICRVDSTIASVIHQLLGRDLAMKMSQATVLAAKHPEFGQSKRSLTAAKLGS